ncbi:formin-like protein 5 isoform X2 [Corvus moneduloides]|uniref:formin-like protein 5 isoform X2 n=1 Tax=Corvus moneduloides TaxID=1196302 RepID=UPI0013641D17|nr:formin-like protein 5 isoform X2 [Corvus moneduloides]
MGQPEPPGVFDLGVLRTPRGLLLAGELVLSGGVVALLAPRDPPMSPQVLSGGVVALLAPRDPPMSPRCCPGGWWPCWPPVTPRCPPRCCPGGWWPCWPPPRPPPWPRRCSRPWRGLRPWGGSCCGTPPGCPPATAPACVPSPVPQDLLRAVSGTLIFLVVALVALASSRDALAATTFIPTRSAADGHRPPPLSPCPPVSPPHFGGPAPQIKPRPTPGAAQGRVGGVGWARGHRVPLVAH